MKYNDFQNDHKVVMLAGGAVGTDTSAALDCKGVEQVAVLLQTGVCGAGTLDVTVEDSADGTTGWATLSGAVFAQLVDANDNVSRYGVIKTNKAGVKRYLRISAVVATAAMEYGAALIAKNVSGEEYPVTVGALPAAAFSV